VVCPKQTVSSPPVVVLVVAALVAPVVVVVIVVVVVAQAKAVHLLLFSPCPKQKVSLQLTQTSQHHHQQHSPVLL
jgi:hypothetical protein